MPPRRQRDANAVRGPNSALTAFLREQGINANVIRERHLARQNGEADDEELEEGEATVSVQIEEEDEEEEEEEQMMRQAAREKRRRANRNLDSEDDEEYDELDAAPRKSLPGETIKCIECSKKFKVTVYTKSFVKNGNKGYLCEECNELNKIKMKNLKKTQIKARKRRQLIAKSLLDQKEFNISTLQDICIRLISENISNVESLGDIGSVNYNKLARILSRNRSLNNKTISLFLMSNLTTIEFSDCSNVDADSFNKMIAYCPNLKTLTLSMCGQFNNQNLLNLATLPQLDFIQLDGPFLINEPTWQNFFELINTRLKGFKLNNTHRFNNDCMQSFLANSGENLEVCSLATLDGLTDPLSYELIPHYFKKLKYLEISYPRAEIYDQTILNILQVNPDLETLSLENLEYITDDSLLGIMEFCSNLQNLSLVNTNFTNDGFLSLFANWTMNHGLMELNLHNNLNIADDSLLAILEHSKNSLIKLNINSCRSLTTAFWKKIPQMPLLTLLDCGFVRSFNNQALTKVIKQCANLKVLECYGANKCNDIDINKNGLKIIGREVDTLAFL